MANDDNDETATDAESAPAAAATEGDAAAAAAAAPAPAEAAMTVDAPPPSSEPPVSAPPKSKAPPKPKKAAPPEPEPKPKPEPEPAAARSEPPAAAARKADIHPAPASGGHGAAAHAAGHDDHGLAHTASLPMLFGVWGGLMVLTIITVTVTQWDFGSATNLIVAMVIATIKAIMVMAFFMHLLWDKRFNALVFLSSVLFVLLFITLLIQDRNEYQPSIDALEAAQAAASAQ